MVDNVDQGDTIVKTMHGKKYVIHNIGAQTGIRLEIYDSLGRIIEKSEFIRAPGILKKYVGVVDPVTTDITYSILEYYQAIPYGRCIFYDSLGKEKMNFITSANFR